MTESEATSEAASEQFVRAQPYGDLLNPPAGAAHHGDVYRKRNPVEFRFNSKEVFIHRDEKTGDVILSSRPSWKEILAQIDPADIPEDFLSPEERNQQPPRDPPGL